MTKTRSLLASTVLAIAVAGLCGCVSLLPKTKPAQLYRFAFQEARSGTPDCSAADKTGVLFSPPTLPRASGGDQMLTITGDQAAYVADSRWVAPALSLFEDAVQDAFQTSCQVRLVRRTDVGAASVRIRVDVDRFEIDYAAAGAAPTVRIALNATILKRDGDFGSTAAFEASQPAADNRVGAIVTAYSAATTKAVADLKAWTESQAPQISARQNSLHPAAEPAIATLRGRTVTTSSSTTSTTTRSPR